VLRPGGRLSVFEPVNDYAFPEPEGWFHFWDVGPVAGLAERVKAHVRAAARDGTLGGFDERDLLRWAEEAGFREVHLEYRADVAPTDPFPHYEALERSSSNPLAPTLGEAIDAALGPGEAARFRAHLRAAVEEGRGVERQAVAYVWAARGP
jgi:arsenite methyltransferase